MIPWFMKKPKPSPEYLKDALAKWNGDICDVILNEPITSWSFHDYAHALAMLARHVAEAEKKRR